MTVPAIDPLVRYCGVSKMRQLNRERLRELEGLVVITDEQEPLVVIVPFGLYLEIQTLAQRIVPPETERK